MLGSFFHEGINREVAVVRIGISGTGAQPHYCIEEGEVAQTYENPELGKRNLRGYRCRLSFHGRSHNPILEEEFKGISWSSTTATYSEVQSILWRT